MREQYCYMSIYKCMLHVILTRSWKDSVMSLAWTSEHGLKAHQMYYWLQKFERDQFNILVRAKQIAGLLELVLSYF